MTIFSDGSDAYSATNLPRGDYVVTVTAPAGFHLTTTNKYTVTVTVAASEARVPDTGMAVLIFLPVVERQTHDVSIQATRTQETQPCNNQPIGRFALFTLVVVGLLLWVRPPGTFPTGNLADALLSTNTIAYQGRLADTAGNPANGPHTMVFRLYPTGGTAFWEEAWTSPNTVQVTDGLFNVMLGSLTALSPSVIANNSELWLGITVNIDVNAHPYSKVDTYIIADSRRRR